MPSQAFSLLRVAQDKISAPGGFVKNRKVETVRLKSGPVLGFCLMGAVLAAMFEAMKGPNADGAPLQQYVTEHAESDADPVAVNVLYEALLVTPRWYEANIGAAPGSKAYEHAINVSYSKASHKSKVGALYAFNDRSSKEHVVKLLDDAILLAKTAG